MKRTKPRLPRRWGVAALVGGIVLGSGAVASADSLGPIKFESPPYTVGNINGQQGWVKAGAYDVAVASTASFPWARRYHFGKQALRLSDAFFTGAFDQTYSPALTKPAGERSRPVLALRGELQDWNHPADRAARPAHLGQP